MIWVVVVAVVLALILVTGRRVLRRYRNWRIQEYRHRQAWQEVKRGRN